MSEKLHKLITQVKKNSFIGRLLTLDPGETTGYAILDRTLTTTQLIEQGQLNTWPLENCVPAIESLFEKCPKFVVYEAYHVYSWRMDEHKFSEVPTIQIIGCIRTIGIQRGVGCNCQTAQTGKAFFNDDRLKMLDLYSEGQRHARDAVRHACQFVTFGLKNNSN